MKTNKTDGQEVLNVLASFYKCMDDHRCDAAAESFTDDAVFVLPNGDEIHGRREIASFLEKRTRRGKHLGLNHTVTFDGDNATLDADFIFIELGQPAWSIAIAGRTVDKLRWDGGWRIERHVVAQKLKF